MDLPRDFGPYRLLRQIAIGGMAEIYLAKTSGFGGFEKLLVLKMIHPKFSEDDHFITMLIEEAKISVQLNHVNIGQVFDLGRIGEHYYIAMEYIEGADLYKMLRRAAEIGVDVPIDSCAHVGHEICAGLDYAHRKRDSNGTPMGIIHRDMSPQNVLVSFAGEVKIVDFGIAKAALRAQQTEVGIIKGKYYYMSPEQAWGDPVDERTDIFSCGIIAYEMLTGQMLYLEDNIEILLDRVRKADIKPPSTKREDIPAELDDIVMKALAKYPDDRYPTARDFGQALGSFLYGFSPDYTPARLAGIMTWLLDDDRSGGGAPSSHLLPDDGVIRTRDDFLRGGVASSGSLLFDLSHVEALAADASHGEDDVSDLDRTALVEAPHVRRASGRAGGAELPGDATAHLDLPDDEAAPGRNVGRFAYYSTSYEGHLDESPWGDEGDDETLVEPEAEMLGRMAEAAGILQRGQPQRRKPYDETRRIEPGDIAPKVAPERPSRPPPPVSPKAGFVVPPPRPSAPPPELDDDLDDEEGLLDPMGSPRAAVTERNLGSPATHPMERFEPDDDEVGVPTGQQAVSPPSPLPSAPTGREAGRVLSGPPPKAPPPERRTRSSVPPPAHPGVPGEAPSTAALRRPPSVMDGPPAEPPKAPRPMPAPPPAGPPLRSHAQPQAGALASAIGETTGPTFIASLADMPTVGPPRDAGLPPQSRPPPPPPRHGADGDTGPTRLAPVVRQYGVGAPHSRADERRIGEDSGPTTVRESGATGAPAAVGPVGPAPPQAMAPWLFGGAAPVPSPEPDPIDGEVLDAAPDAVGLREALSRSTALHDVIRGLTSRTGLKVVAGVVLALGVILGVVLLWPRPAPTARLDIRSHPPGARVLLDGEPLPGLTPTTVDGLALESVHQVELRLEGFSPWAQPVRMDDVHVRQIAVLTPIRGVLRVTSEPEGASVYVDGVYRGVTPREVDGLDINRPAEVQARFETESKVQTLDWLGMTEKTVHFVFEAPHHRRRGH